MGTEQFSVNIRNADGTYETIELQASRVTDANEEQNEEKVHELQSKCTQAAYLLGKDLFLAIIRNNRFIDKTNFIYQIVNRSERLTKSSKGFYKAMIENGWVRSCKDDCNSFIPATGGDIAFALGMTSNTVSKHLAVLHAARLIERQILKRKGKTGLFTSKSFLHVHSFSNLEQDEIEQIGKEILAGN